MRKTLHTLPLPLAAAAHSATVHFRERDVLRAITNAGINARCISRVTDAIIELLGQNGLLFHRDIEKSLAGGRITTAAIRLAVKLLWEQGVLTYVNDTIGWNRENRKFVLTSTLYPGLDMFMDRDKATGQLIREYFDRYGPASLHDVMWWSGLSRSAIITAMGESVMEFVAVHAPWCATPMYMYQDRFEEFQCAPARQRHSGLNFLAHEDVALKAFFETRSRYLGDLPPRRAFNQIGEVLPTIILDGQVVGTWTWDTKIKAITFSIDRELNFTELHREAASLANALSDALRLGWVQPTKASDKSPITPQQKKTQ
jgi:hypothetical protein